MTLEPLLSHAAATIFGLSLVAAGLSSTVVGTLAGQVVMQGFIRFHIPLWFLSCGNDAAFVYCHYDGTGPDENSGDEPYC